MIKLIDRALLGIIATTALTVVACGATETDLRITQPVQGSAVNAGDVTVEVEVDNFNVVDKLGQAPEDGEGHVHFYIDIGEIPTVDDEPAVTDEGTYHAQATQEFVWEDVEPGTHTFAVQLVNNDHTPLSPPVIAQVTVEAVEGDDASPTPTATEEEEEPTPTEEEEEPTPTDEPSPTPTRAATTPAGTSTPTPRPSPTATP
jgi:hypothetical protein